MRRRDALKKYLDDLAGSYGPAFLFSDPVEIPRGYGDRLDREVAALLCALFAYGTVRGIRGFLEPLLARLGPSPARALAEGRRVRTGPYRFQTAADVRRFMASAGRLLVEYGSVEAAFRAGGGDAESRLEGLALALRRGAGRETYGLNHLLPLPSSGSACKRWWMFLRWVVRPDDGVDLGLWECMNPSELIVPVDTHMARVALELGLTSRKTPDRRFAREVTESLRALCPEDPARYDFALTRQGILRR